jgi:hypothetical protein
MQVFLKVKYSATMLYPLAFFLLFRISGRKIVRPAPLVAFTVAWLLEGWGVWGGGDSVFHTTNPICPTPEWQLVTPGV